MDAHQSAPLAIGASTCADAVACSVFVRAKPVSLTGTGIARAAASTSAARWRSAKKCAK
jgi:hypothetical protein